MRVILLGSHGQPRRVRSTLAALSALVAGLILAPAASCASSERPLPAKIVLAGDSTTAPHTGYGGVFCSEHVASLVACLPLGRGGRSSKTYRAKESWQLVLDELRAPGYARRLVLIEFGHNDKSTDPAIGTAIDTEYPANLARFVTEARATGATPILVTPLASRHFVAGQLADTMVPWAAQVRAVAARLGVPLLDLNRASADAYQRLGPAGALALELRPASAAELAAARAGTTLPSATSPADPNHADYIHLNDRGAVLVSGLVAGLLRDGVPAARDLVVP